MRLNFIFGIAAAVVSGMLVSSCTKEFDPSYLEQQIAGLEQRVKALENAAEQTNSSISAIQKIVEALQKNLHITSVEETSQGTVITFSNGKTATIGGGNGTNAPVVGVKEVSGVYYWTLGGELIKDNSGKPLPVTGAAPQIGVKKEGSNYYWTVNGQYLLDASGNKVPANYGSSSSDSLFQSVSVKNGVVTFVLKDGQSFVIPMMDAANLRIDANKLHFGASETKSVHITADKIVALTVTEKPEGWKATIEGNTVKIQAPSASAAGADKSGYLAVLGTSGSQTFIGKVRLTMDKPLFTMSVSPTGKMTLTELDTDFNAPGFWAGFVKAEDFDPAAIVEPAKAYTPSAGDDFYTSWSSASTGKKTFDVTMKESGITPEVGQVYAAYCFPGYYSKNIGVDPDPYDVEVQYFTYVGANFSFSGVTADRANVSVTVSGASSFYGGMIRYYSDDELPSLRNEFLVDAQAPLMGVGDGIYGVLMQQYSGQINMFAALDDGEGNKNPKTILPGGKYAFAVIPRVEGKAYSEYVPGDVIIETLQLNTPSKSSSELAWASAGKSTTTSASAVFSIASNVSKFYYVLAPSETIKASGLSEYDYATRKGAVWDRSILKVSGAIDGLDLNCTSIKPGTECTAVGVAFTSSGQYYVSTIKVYASEVLISDGTITLSSCTLTPISQNSVKASFKCSASSGVKTVRYVEMSKSDFASVHGSKDDSVFDMLTAGQRWDYEEVNAGSDIEIYVYPDGEDHTLFAVGVDEAGKFTKLAKLSFKPVK